MLYPNLALPLPSAKYASFPPFPHHLGAGGLHGKEEPLCLLLDCLSPKLLFRCDVHVTYTSHSVNPPFILSPQLVAQDIDVFA